MIVDLLTTTNNTDAQGNPITWDYNRIKFKELSKGPDYCASGDMCWGTNIFDGDYTDDLFTDPNPYTDPISYTLSTPVLYLDNALNDTFLRFSSWHELETKFNQQGDLYYDDCAYIEIEYSPIGQFTGEQLSEPLLINFPQTTGVGPQNGLYAKDDGSYSANRISPECGALENNFFGLAGTSTSPQN